MKLVMSTAVAVLSAAVFSPAMGVVGGSGAPWEGPFQQRWSLPVEGELIGLEVAADRVYAVTLEGSTLEVSAVNLVDGGVAWQHTVTNSAWTDPDYWGSATEYGPLFTFGADDGGQLVLLDAGDGGVRWDEPLFRPAYDVYSQVNDHVALVEVSEGDRRFVDLDTAEQADAGGYFPDDWTVVGDELARIGGDVMFVGWDPFDAAARTSTITLPAGTDDIDSSHDGRLVVATVDAELVGMVNGKEAWRWQPDVEFGHVYVLDGLIGVDEVVNSVYTGRSQFAQVSNYSIDPLAVLPETFAVQDVSIHADGSAAAVGVFDQTPGSWSSEETVAPATIELQHGSTIHKIPARLDGLAAVGAFGDYLYTASSQDEHIVIYRGDPPQLVTSIQYPEENSLIDIGNGIIVHDAASSTISVYA